jgi:transposase
VLVANTRRLPAPGRAKTDRLDARMLARLAASGLLETVWTPDEQTRALRRVCARRDSLVKGRTRAKTETQAVLNARAARVQHRRPVRRSNHPMVASDPPPSPTSPR